MTRASRRVERVEFDTDRVDEIVQYLDRLAEAGDGWINLVPATAEGDEPRRVGFLSLFGGGSIGFTMCTWVPPRLDAREPVAATLGIAHNSGRRAVAQLQASALAIPPTWIVEQDHPRRGLVIRIPASVAHEEVLTFALRATSALSDRGRIGMWRADVHFPAT